MGERAREETVGQFGFILDRLGLSGDEARGTQRAPAHPDEDVFEADTDSLLLARERLLETLVESTCGFEAPRDYWNELPGIQLQAVLEPRDRTVLVNPNHDDVDRIPPAPGDAATLGVRDRIGGTWTHTQFEYPDTHLGDDNYPALLDAVGRDLLADTNLEFVRLVDDGDRWRFLLVKRERLAALRTEFGDRIQFQGEPLLAAHQPAAFAPDTDGDTRDATDRPPELREDRHGETDTRSIGGLFEDVATTSTDTVSTTPTIGTGNASTTHSQETSPADDRRHDDTYVEVDGAGLVGTDATTGEHSGTDGGHELDEAFDDLEREAAMSTFSGSRTTDDDDVTSADLFDAIGHDNADDDVQFEDGFIWLDRDELTQVPDELADATGMTFVSTEQKSV